MMLRVLPYEDLAAKAVIDRLDPADHLECELVRGSASTPLAIWADWRAMQGFRIASFVAITGETPFAIFGLSHTGQAGVAGAVLLARDHAAFRVPLARLAVRIRSELPTFIDGKGVHRIEARSWADHPTASGLLRSIGFVRECDMRGFGLTGGVTFRQWAWLVTDRHPRPVSVCQNQK
jgi:hypothetical protein